MAETWKQRWRREHPLQDFDKDAGCRDYRYPEADINSCGDKKCVDCWNEEVRNWNEHAK